MINVANLKVFPLMHLVIVASSCLTILNFAGPAFCDDVKDTTPKVNAEQDDREPKEGEVTVTICDSPGLRDQPQWQEWEKAIVSRLDNQGYKRFEPKCTCLGPRICRIDFTIDQCGKVSDANFASKTNNALFNELALAVVMNLTNTTPIPFPPDTAIKKLKMSSEFVCRRSFMRAD
ncbi:MAG: hypothetical protein P4L53_10030 [Candidatus Obscuribacterales bacterium]|nr:hypothetical protein [Candidatus Obscuribacterales bacterium]